MAGDSYRDEKGRIRAREDHKSRQLGCGCLVILAAGVAGGLLAGLLGLLAGSR